MIYIMKPSGKIEGCAIGVCVCACGGRGVGEDPSALCQMNLCCVPLKGVNIVKLTTI